MLRRVSLSTVEPGVVIGSDLKVPSSQPGVLYKLRLEAGTELTETHLERLRSLGIQRIPIQDDRTEDLDRYIHDPEVEAAQDEVQIAFERLTTELENKNVDVRSLNELKTSIDELIDTLQDTEVMAAYTTLKNHDSYTAQHSLDVAQISLQFALHYENELKNQLHEESGATREYIDKNMLTDLGLGAMLHDIGKQDIKNEILNKPNELSESEREAVQEHPEFGYEQLKMIAPHFNAPVRIPVYQHHERYDGSGYPQGLKRKEIHLFGRVSHCADVYSALTSNRPYREPLVPSQALKVMDRMQNEGPQFDPEIYDRFLDLITPYPIGQEVTLDDGRRGVVCDLKEGVRYRPVVRILEDTDGNRLDPPEEIQVQADSISPRIVEPDPMKASLVRI